MRIPTVDGTGVGAATVKGIWCQVSARKPSTPASPAFSLPQASSAPFASTKKLRLRPAATVRSSIALRHSRWSKNSTQLLTPAGNDNGVQRPTSSTRRRITVSTKDMGRGGQGGPK
jgi:hypothetical protein